jgi:hypothetical protein
VKKEKSCQNCLFRLEDGGIQHCFSYDADGPDPDYLRVLEAFPKVPDWCPGGLWLDEAIEAPAEDYVRLRVWPAVMVQPI